MAVLKHNAYGKGQVRLTKVTRGGNGRHELHEMAVEVRLEGDFARCYTEGDNGQIIPTDTMKNTVYALARNHTMAGIEAFAKLLAGHFINTFSHVSVATITIHETPWQRITIGGRPHDHAFVGGSSERRTCAVTHARAGGRVSVHAGIHDLLVLKTTKSGFVGFIKDKYTTLRETTDRIFATSVTADWTYANADADEWNAYHDAVRSTFLRVFAEHDSLAVQQTLYAMGEAALDACSAIEEIAITMPNQHRLLVNLQPFGMENPNEIFVPTDEPYGIISGTIARG
jgi:urate oxidase